MARQPKEQGQEHQEQRSFSADQARGGEIILRTRWRRIVFMAGLAGFVLLALVMRITSG